MLQNLIIIKYEIFLNSCNKNLDFAILTTSDKHFRISAKTKTKYGIVEHHEIILRDWRTRW